MRLRLIQIVDMKPNPWRDWFANARRSGPITSWNMKERVRREALRVVREQCATY